MKQGTLVTRVVILTLFAAVLAYLGFYVWQGLSEPYQLVATYTYQMDDGLALDGVVVRQEAVIEGRSELSEVLPQEGEKVAKGAAVALVYDTPQPCRGAGRPRNCGSSWSSSTTPCAATTPLETPTSWTASW